MVWGSSSAGWRPIHRSSGETQQCRPCPSPAGPESASHDTLGDPRAQQSSRSTALVVLVAQFLIFLLPLVHCFCCPHIWLSPTLPFLPSPHCIPLTSFCPKSSISHSPNFLFLPALKPPQSPLPTSLLAVLVPSTDHMAGAHQGPSFCGTRALLLLLPREKIEPEV